MTHIINNNEEKQLYPNGMLKTDIEICKKYMPDTTVRQYFKSPFNTIRIIMFTNNTFIGIETPDSNGNLSHYLNQFNIPLNNINTVIDKKNRTISVYQYENNISY